MRRSRRGGSHRQFQHPAPSVDWRAPSNERSFVDQQLHGTTSRNLSVIRTTAVSIAMTLSLALPRCPRGVLLYVLILNFITSTSYAVFFTDLQCTDAILLGRLVASAASRTSRQDTLACRRTARMICTAGLCSVQRAGPRPYVRYLNSLYRAAQPSYRG